VGVAFNKIIKLTDIEEGILIETTEEDFADIWRKFLDLDTDYEEIGNGFPKDNFTKAAVEFGRGLRILQQDPWEALCSFIISQCNNIPRIQGIIDKLCTLYGDKIIWQGKTLYTFPSAMVISTLTVDDLAPLKCGYRAPYIINAAKQVACGKIDFDALRNSLIRARVEVGESTTYSASTALSILDKLLDGGYITAQEYIEHLPEGFVLDREMLVKKGEPEDGRDGETE
jgi:hypothetical protein